jgi:hypothetical protein
MKEQPNSGTVSRGTQTPFQASSTEEQINSATKETSTSLSFPTQRKATTTVDLIALSQLPHHELPPNTPDAHSVVHGKVRSSDATAEKPAALSSATQHHDKNEITPLVPSPSAENRTHSGSQHPPSESTSSPTQSTRYSASNAHPIQAQVRTETFPFSQSY